VGPTLSPLMERAQQGSYRVSEDHSAALYTETALAGSMRLRAHALAATLSTPTLPYQSCFRLLSANVHRFLAQKVSTQSCLCGLSSEGVIAQSVRTLRTNSSGTSPFIAWRIPYE